MAVHTSVGALTAVLRFVLIGAALGGLALGQAAASPLAARQAPDRGGTQPLLPVATERAPEAEIEPALIEGASLGEVLPADEDAWFTAASTLSAVPASGAAAVREQSNGWWAPRFVRGVNGWTSRLYAFTDSYEPWQINLFVYDQSGQAIATRTLPFPAGGQALIRAEDLVPAGLSGSAALFSTRLMAVAVEEQNGATTIAYEASIPLDRLGFPAVWKTDSQGSALLALHNVTDRSGDVAITFYPLAGPAIEGPMVTLPPFGSRTVNLGEIAALPRGFVGSAVAQSATAAIAGAVVGGPSAEGTRGYAGFRSGEERLLAPASNLWRQGQPAAISVQNLGGAAVQVSVSRQRVSGSYPPETRTIAPGASTLIDATPAGQTEAESVAITGPPGATLVGLVQAGPFTYRALGPGEGAAYLPHAEFSVLYTQNLWEEDRDASAIFVDPSGLTFINASWPVPAGGTVARTAAEMGVPPGFTGVAWILGPTPLGVVAR